MYDSPAARAEFQAAFKMRLQIGGVPPESIALKMLSFAEWVFPSGAPSQVVSMVSLPATCYE